MLVQKDPFETHVSEYEAWFDRYPEVFNSEMLALKRQFEKLPENLHGIEVGMGSGRYAIELGIKEGVEPSDKLRDLALEKGLDVMDAVAEHLPYKDLSFDFVLFVSIEHLSNLKESLLEAHRVLKTGGHLIIAFIDKESSLFKKYNEKRSVFYRQATFYSVKKVASLLKECAFKELQFMQTLIKDIDEIKEIEEPKEGFGEGSFVIISAIKN